MIKFLVPLAGIIGGLALVVLSVFADTGSSVSGMAVGGVIAGPQRRRMVGYQSL